MTVLEPKFATILETPRLLLRQLNGDDAPFIVELVNEPGWLRFIGDKGVRNLDDARNYIRHGPMASYERFGFGLYAVAMKEDASLIGMCGLLKRDALPDVDIGFAFLQRHQGRGYAHEAAAGTMTHARRQLGLKRVVAITTVDNDSSAKVLTKIGMHFESMVKSEGEADLRLFAIDLSPRPEIVIAIERPDQPDSAGLIAELDRYQTSLYPAESNHLLDIDSLAQPNVLFAVARDAAGMAQGCGAVVLYPEFGEVKRMFVRPEQRGQGIAGSLLRFLEERARSKGCSVLMLETGISQPEAIGLYRRFGYADCAPFGDYREDPLSIFMRKVLSPR